jgi:AmmeMemoRadiSam system protein A
MRELTAGELEMLAAVARESIVIALGEGRAWIPDPSAYPAPLRERAAAFVTVRREGALRGCLGTFETREALVVTVADRARAAIFDDPRFAPVTASELHELDVEVSVLGPTQPMVVASWTELVAQVEPFVDGLLVEAGRRRATLLPEVWHQLPDPEELCAALWHKAGLVPREWPAGTVVSRYRTQHAGVAVAER